MIELQASFESDTSIDSMGGNKTLGMSRQFFLNEFDRTVVGVRLNVL